MPKTYSLTSAEGRTDPGTLVTFPLSSFYKQDCFLWAKRHYIIHSTIFPTRKLYCFLWARWKINNGSQRSTTALHGNWQVWLMLSEREEDKPCQSSHVLSCCVQLVLGLLRAPCKAEDGGVLGSEAAWITPLKQSISWLNPKDFLFYPHAYMYLTHSYAHANLREVWKNVRHMDDLHAYILTYV